MNGIKIGKKLYFGDTVKVIVTGKCTFVKNADFSDTEMMGIEKNGSCYLTDSIFHRVRIRYCRMLLIEKTKKKCLT